MILFITFIFRVFSFAIFVTGFCGLLNYLFNWHLSLEGTEAPADFDGAVILICVAITLFMWGELAANNHYVVKYTKKWYSFSSYILLSVLLSVIPIIYFINSYQNSKILFEALAENEISEFQNKENLKKLSQKDLGTLFSESIRRNSPEIAKLILEYLKDINGEKDSPNLLLVAYLCNPEFFKILIDKQADFSVKGNYLGNSVLHSIVTGKGKTSDKIIVTKMLVEKKLVEIDALDNYQVTPLMNAVERGEYELVETLLSLKADLNKVDHVGNPVLTRVCEKSSVYPDVTEEARIRTIQVLLKFGVDKKVKDYLGRDCSEMAKRDGFEKLMELF